MDFLALAQICGPMVDPVTTTAIVRTESSFNPLAIRDSSANITLSPRSLEEARGMVREGIAAGHRLAIGLMQVTTPWAKRLRIGPELLLDACKNIAVGTAILANNYQGCLLSRRAAEPALVCALSMYWSGSGEAGGVYVNRVFKMAGSPLRVEETPGVTDGILVSSTDVVISRFEPLRYPSQTFSFSAGRTDFAFSARRP
jgi:type IV secretion system protein VirB1